MALPNPGELTKKLLRFFKSGPKAKKMGFLSSFFKTGPEDITDAEFVSVDIERTDEDVAPVLRNISTGAVTIKTDVYTNKTIKPPYYALDWPLNTFDLMQRQPGDTEHENLGNWTVKLISLLIRGWNKMFQMFIYAIELQASQILQTGSLSINDEKGNATYILDYLPKATHFPTTATSWSDHANATPLDDIDALADVIRDDGLVDVTDVIMGSGAYKNFIRNADVIALLDNRRMDIGNIAPAMAGMGAKLQGVIRYSNYVYNIWTYNARFVDFFTRTKSKYMADDLVILLPAAEDLDFRKVYGGIPEVLPSMDPFNQFMPARVTIGGVTDFKARVYADQKANTITAELQMRPILIPVSIDRFGCLDTQI